MTSAAAQAASAATDQQTASDAAADDEKAAETAGNDAEAVWTDDEAQACHDVAIAEATAENAYALTQSGNAKSLAAAEAYFAALPDALSGPGGDSPITLTGDYGDYHLGRFKVDLRSI